MKTFREYLKETNVLLEIFSDPLPYKAYLDASKSFFSFFKKKPKDIESKFFQFIVNDKIKYFVKIVKIDLSYGKDNKVYEFSFFNIDNKGNENYKNSEETSGNSIQVMSTVNKILNDYFFRDTHLKSGDIIKYQPTSESRDKVYESLFKKMFKKNNINFDFQKDKKDSNSGFPFCYFYIK